MHEERRTMEMGDLKRGIVKIKPVYFGILHYREKSPSAGLSNILTGRERGEIGARPIYHTTEDLTKNAQGMINEFKKRMEVDFVEIEKPLIIKEQKDLRRLAAELSYDVDALLVGTLGRVPLELHYLSRYGLPFINSRVVSLTPSSKRSWNSDFLRALRVKKFLKESKFLYIGEFPSFDPHPISRDLYGCEDRLGVRVRQIETNEFYRLFDGFSDEEVKKELENWKKDFGKIVEPTSDQDLLNVTRIYLTLRYLCRREDANGVTINCQFYFSQERLMAPCLAFNRLIDEGIMCGCAGDITATLSSLILHAVSGQSVLMGNFGYQGRLAEVGVNIASPDLGAKMGEVALSHCHSLLSMASTKKYKHIHQHHGEFGVAAYADIRKEPMTILNLDASLNKISVIEGTIRNSVESPNDGSNVCHTYYLSVDGDIKRIPQIMVGTEHASMTFGHWLGTLKEVGDLLGLEVRHLSTG